ncbi:MAG: thiamine pyrophosphate-binding protein [Acidimicrobiia bacterium]
MTEKPQGARTGADAFIDSLVAAGARYVFGNPGTTEQAFLDALGDRDDIELVVALHEGVAVGAADGYARLTGRPAVVQLHTMCGLGNAMGMLSNADFGRSPLVVYVGGAAQRAAHTEPALGGDLVAMAASVTRWAWEVRSVEEIPTVVARAFKVALTPPFGPVVIAVPNDLMDQACSGPIAPPTWISTTTQPDTATIDMIAARAIAAESPAIVIGDGVGGPGAGAAISRLAHAIGAPVYGAYLTQAVLPDTDSLDAGDLPLFDSAAARTRLEGHDLLLAIGVDLLRSVFPEPGAPLPGANVIHIAATAWDLGKNQPCTAIVADELTATELVSRAVEQSAAQVRTRARRERVEQELELARSQRRVSREAARRERPLGIDGVLAQLAAVLPHDAIVFDESVSAMPAVAEWLPRCPGAWFRSRGGGLGAGMSAPVGAALAMPNRPIVAVVGDGSMMYTNTALWTAARHRLQITWVILDNGGYRILEANTRAWRSALGSPDRPFVGTDLGHPSIDIAGVATAFGVAAWRVDGAELLEPALKGALAQAGPALVHVIVAR